MVARYAVTYQQQVSRVLIDRQNQDRNLHADEHRDAKTKGGTSITWRNRHRVSSK